MTRQGTHISNIKGLYLVTSTAPSDPITGDEYFDAVTGTLFIYNGSAWIGYRYTSTSSTSSSTSTTTTSSSTTTSTSVSTSTTTTSTSTTL